MPIYEYACHDCEHRFETIQKAAENPLRECPACGRPALKKLLSAPVFRLKGSGWYETDFKTGDKRNVVEGADAKGEAKNGDGEAKDAASGENAAAKGGDGATPGKQEKKKEAPSAAKPAGKAPAGDKPKERPKPGNS